MFKKATKTAKGGSGIKMDAPLLDAGSYPARLLAIVDIGLQPGSRTYPEPKHKVQFQFELLDEFMNDEDGNVLEDKPRYFSWDLTYNPDGYMGDRSNIYKLYDAIDGFEKEMPELLGELVSLSIGKAKKQDGKTDKNKITGVATMRPKDKERYADCPLIGEPIFFSTSEPDMEVFAKLSSGKDWCQQEKIKSCLNMDELHELREALGIDLENINNGEADEPVQEKSDIVSGESSDTASHSNEPDPEPQGGSTDTEDIFD